MKVLYTAEATATGGRSGQVKSDNGVLDVSIGPLEGGAFGLAVELAVNISEVSVEEAQRLTERAHQVCPYSNATRNNITVNLVATNN